MNVGESIAVNEVLNFFLGRPGPAGSITSEAAAAAAQRLAEASHKALSAGITPADVARLWLERRKRREARS